MTITINADLAIQEFVEALLPRGSGHKKLLLVGLDITAFAVPSGKEVNRWVMFLFHRPGNYTKVLWNATADPQKILEGLDVWELATDHDSCWPDGISRILQTLELEMRKELEADPGIHMFQARFSMMMGPRIITIEDYDYDREKRTFTITKR